MHDVLERKSIISKDRLQPSTLRKKTKIFQELKRILIKANRNNTKKLQIMTINRIYWAQF
jgi:hypothetical protein